MKLPHAQGLRSVHSIEAGTSELHHLQVSGTSSAIPAQPSEHLPALPRQDALRHAHKQATVPQVRASNPAVHIPCASYLPAPNVMHLSPWQPPVQSIPGTVVPPMGMGVSFQPADVMLPHPHHLQLVSAASIACAQPGAANARSSANPLVTPYTSSMPRTLTECMQYLPLGLRSSVADRIKASAVRRSESLARFRSKKVRSSADKTGTRYVGRKRCADLRPRAGGRFTRQTKK